MPLCADYLVWCSDSALGPLLTVTQCPLPAQTLSVPLAISLHKELEGNSFFTGTLRTPSGLLLHPVGLHYPLLRSL